MQGIAEHPHALGSYPIGTGEKHVAVVAQQLPRYAARLATCKPRHDGRHLSGNDPRFAVICNRRSVETVRRCRFYDCRHRALVAEEVGKVALNGSSERSYPRLKENVRRFLDAKPA